MKKTLLIIAALLAAFTLFNMKANAQTVTGNVPLSIVLSDAFSITLGPNPGVVFTYASAADYVASQTVTKASHFSVISNKPYSINVKATAEFNTFAANTTPVSLGIVQISVDPSTAATGATYSNANLTTTSQIIAAAAAPTIGTAYNIDYTIANGAGLINKAAGTYATNIVYTITQP